jgi:uncharacterized protein (DUF983 family)
MTPGHEFFDPPSPIVSGFRQRCPRCGEGKLFKGFLALAPACDHCGLDYGFAEPADGPAFFVMSGVGILVTFVFAWVEVVYRPPIWVHFVTVFPALILGCLATLRPVKAWLVASQFVNKAEEGKFESLGRHDHDPRRL